MRKNKTETTTGQQQEEGGFLDNILGGLKGRSGGGG